MKDLHNVYRPVEWNELVGQEESIASIEQVVREGRNRSFVLTGPSGCGKTTVARIIARKVGAQVQEIDAASNSGVDAMRSITTNLPYSTLGKKQAKMVIVDEAHSLSPQAWQSLLKIVEEPPPHVWFAFCTTEAHKIPKTIKTRCACYELKRVAEDELFRLIEEVCSAEEVDVEEGVLTLCATKADGSPRQALTLLAMVADCKDRREAARILKEAGEATGETLEFCRMLLKRVSWEHQMTLLKSLEGMNPEGLRRTVFAYFTKVAAGSKSWEKAVHAANVLGAFSQPYPDDSQGHVILSLAGLMDEDDV